MSLRRTASASGLSESPINAKMCLTPICSSTLTRRIFQCGSPEACPSSVRRSYPSFVPDESVHGLRDGPLGVAIVFPRAALRNNARRRAHRESLRIKTFLHLAPRQRHRYGSAVPRSGRQRRHRRRRTIVAKVVEEDAPGARLLSHGDHIAVWTISCHPNADFACEGLRCGPVQLSSSRHRKRGHHMQAFSTRSLAKGDKPEGLEPVPHFVGSGDYAIKLYIRCRIEIEHQSTRSIGIARLAIPRVNLEAGSLRNGRQTFDTIDLKVRFAVARYSRRLQQMGHAPHGMTLKE